LARWIPGAGEGWRDVAVLLQEAALMVVLPGQEPQRTTFSIKRTSGKKTK
jgi:hypothetical protein